MHNKMELSQSNYGTKNKQVIYVNSVCGNVGHTNILNLECENMGHTNILNSKHENIGHINILNYFIEVRLCI